jgi:hypothetical protein
MILPTTGQSYAAPPAYEDVAFSPSTGTVIPTAVDFGGQLQLDGYSATYDVGENAFVVDLLWRAKQQIAVPYFFSALLLAPDGSVLPAVDWQPFDYQYPTTCWHMAGSSLIDRIRLPMGENSPDGDYWLSLSLFYITENGEMIRLPVTSPAGEDDTQVGLGPLTRE